MPVRAILVATLVSVAALHQKPALIEDRHTLDAAIGLRDDSLSEIEQRNVVHISLTDTSTSPYTRAECLDSLGLSGKSAVDSCNGLAAGDCSQRYLHTEGSELDGEIVLCQLSLQGCGESHTSWSYSCPGSTSGSTPGTSLQRCATLERRCGSTLGSSQLEWWQGLKECCELEGNSDDACSESVGLAYEYRDYVGNNVSVIGSLIDSATPSEQTCEVLIDMLDIINQEAKILDLDKESGQLALTGGHNASFQEIERADQPAPTCPSATQREYCPAGAPASGYGQPWCQCVAWCYYGAAPWFRKSNSQWCRDCPETQYCRQQAQNGRSDTFCQRRGTWAGEEAMFCPQDVSAYAAPSGYETVGVNGMCTDTSYTGFDAPLANGQLLEIRGADIGTFNGRYTSGRWGAVASSTVCKDMCDANSDCQGFVYWDQADAVSPQHCRLYRSCERLGNRASCGMCGWHRHEFHGSVAYKKQGTAPPIAGPLGGASRTYRTVTGKYCSMSYYAMYEGRPLPDGTTITMQNAPQICRQMCDQLECAAYTLAVMPRPCYVHITRGAPAGHTAHTFPWERFTYFGDGSRPSGATGCGSTNQMPGSSAFQLYIPIAG